MNQEIVQERLAKLYPEEGGPHFTVLFTGKHNARVNGLYYPDAHEILIHNLNFKNDGDLMYTAIHELTHHIMIMKHGTLGKGHPSLFWATFHDLLTLAEQKKIWKPVEMTDEQVQLVKEITEMLPKVTEMEQRVGRKILELHTSTKESGGRIEDFIDRKLRMSKISAKLYQQILIKLDDAIYNPDAAKIIATTKARISAESNIANGKSLDQTKQEIKGIKQRADVLPEDERKKALIAKLKNERAKADDRVSAAAGRRLAIDAELKKLTGEEDADDDE